MGENNIRKTVNTQNKTLTQELQAVQQEACRYYLSKHDKYLSDEVQCKVLI
jgi:hypothetical protein